MVSADLCIAAVIAVVIGLTVAVHLADKGGVKSGYCGGPENINMYDYPYWGYPHYEGRDTLWWDADGRCSAFCQQSPCTVWCR